MKKHLFTLCLLLLALGACSDSQREEVTPFGVGEDLLTLNLSLPREEMRSSFVQLEGSLDMQTHWSKHDKVHFFAQQEGKLYDLGETEVFRTEDNTVGYQVKVPTGAIVRSKPFTLYGVHQASPSIKDAMITVSACQMLGFPLRLFNPPLYGKLEVDNLTKYHGTLTLRFQHYGIYEVTHLRNASDRAIAIHAPFWQNWAKPRAPRSGSEIDIQEGDIVDDENREKKQSSVSEEEGSDSRTETIISSVNIQRPWSNNIFNLLTGLTLYDQKKPMAIGSAVRIAPGQTKSFVSWTVLSVSRELPDKLVLSAIIKPQGGVAREVFSPVYGKAARHALQAGRTYHLAAVWDGRQLLWDGQMWVGGIGRIEPINNGGLNDGGGGCESPDVPGEDVVNDGGVNIPNVPGQDI